MQQTTCMVTLWKTVTQLILTCTAASTLQAVMQLNGAEQVRLTAIKHQRNNPGPGRSMVQRALHMCNCHAKQ